MPAVRIKDHWREQRLFDQRALVSAAIIGLATVALIARLFVLQVSRHDYYADLSQGNRVRTEPIPAARGLILDRHGELIAEGQLIYNWEALPAEVARLVHPHPTQTEAIGEAHHLLPGKPLHVHG